MTVNYVAMVCFEYLQCDYYNGKQDQRPCQQEQTTISSWWFWLGFVMYPHGFCLTV